MRHGSIDWFALLISLIMLIFIFSGATWCVSPKSFVKVHRTIFPRSAISNTAKWESEVCSISGRVRGAVFASFAVFILYQVWLFISPGMYAHEKKYVVPFMTATVGLFLAGAWFGYHWVLPGAMTFLIQDIGKNFSHMITIEDYTQFFLSVILGLGICFELPILMFFLALFGVVDGKFFLRQWRYAVLIIFLVSAIICPLQDPFSMCLFASPMLLLYIVGVGTAFLVHPDRRKAREAKMSA